jgi:peptide/nickel transport system permease protein
MSSMPHIDPVELAALGQSSRREKPGPAGGEPGAGYKPRSMLALGWEVFAENKMAVVSLGIVIFFILFSFVGPLIYHTNQYDAQLTIKTYMQPPSARHLLGTDDVGYDELGRLMLGGQAVLEVGLSAALLACTFGTLYGAFSGYVGGYVDALLMRIVDALDSIPDIFVLILLAVIIRPDAATMIFFIAVFYWPDVARLVRGETLSLRGREYVEAVRVSGGTNSRAILRHIIPNAIGTIIVQATFAVADSVELLAGLGFLGFGIQPPSTDWGTMLNDGLTYVMDGAWWLIYPPGICIILLVVAWNFIGDSLRDAFETRLQRR